MKYRDIAKILTANGFTLESTGKGSHRRFAGVVNGQNRKVTVPYHSRDIKQGTVGSIIRQSGLQKNLFRN